MYRVVALIGAKNNAVPPDAFPVVASPLLSFERHDIAAEWILGRLSQFFEQECVVITRYLFELPCRLICESDAPFHVRVFLK